jgi:hypothetical protein
MQTNNNTDTISVTSKWPLTPLVTAADLPETSLPVQQIPEDLYYVLEDHGERRVENGTLGSSRNHKMGILGEGALATFLDTRHSVDTSLYDRGDGGIDLVFNGATIDVKTRGRHRSTPSLTVDAYQELRADYYALVHRIGLTNFRLIGYAPRKFVANAPIREHDGRKYHEIEQRDLFPFPSSLL